MGAYAAIKCILRTKFSPYGTSAAALLCCHRDGLACVRPQRRPATRSRRRLDRQPRYGYLYGHMLLNRIPSRAAALAAASGIWMPQHLGARLPLQRVLAAAFSTAASEPAAKSAESQTAESTDADMPSASAAAGAAAAAAASAADKGPSGAFGVGDYLRALFAVGLAGTGAYTVWSMYQDPLKPSALQEKFVNWSGTHEVTTSQLYQPESEDEIVQILKQVALRRSRIRVVGSALSPNGISFCEDSMLSMALMDKIIKVDPEKQQVTVQAGARVLDVVEALRPYGLTLQNYASIREQQIGGFIQVGAHGTGATLPPVDEQVVALRLIAPAGLSDAPDTPAAVELNSSQATFGFARVGLGALGVVTDVTLQCVPAHRLLEYTFVATRQQVERNHLRWLRQHRHLRYMWIPGTDAVVVVWSDPTSKQQAPRAWGEHTPDQRLQPLRELLRSRQPEMEQDELQRLSATQLRDALIELDPLNRSWILQVNRAEAEFWKRSQGYRLDWSDEILGFDCGGQQWVLETAFPCGTLANPNGNDLAFMKELHSWVGIIMYLPSNDPQQRADITNRFHQYAKMLEGMMPQYQALWHWAKLEVPADRAERLRLQQYLASRYDVAGFNRVRRALDPHGILSNALLDGALPVSVNS